MFKKILEQVEKNEVVRLNEELGKLAENYAILQAKNYAKCDECRRILEANSALIQSIKDAESEIKKLKNSETTIPELQREIGCLELLVKSKEKDIENLRAEINSSEKFCLSKENKLLDEIARRVRAEEKADYYKKLAENYQSMPDLKRIVENISAYKIPDVQTFVDALKQMQQLSEPVKNLSGKLEKIEGAITSSVTHEVRRAVEYVYNEFRHRRF